MKPQNASCSCVRKKYRVPHWHIKFVMSLEGYLLWSKCGMNEAFWARFSDHFAHCLDLPVQEFCRYLTDFPHFQEAEAASYKGLIVKCEVCECIEASQPQQVSKTGWFTIWSVFEVVAHVCVYSDRYVQPLVHSGSNPWSRYQGHDHITVAGMFRTT